jgi:hypothetical protein
MKARTAWLLLVALAVVATLGGCASGLDVGYPEAGANRALLSSVAPRRITVGPVTDRRVDQTRIGAKPKNGDPIATSRPVANIVRDALVVELTKNGHTVVASEGEIALAADVEDFWLDTAGRNSSTQYVGRVAIALAVMDGRSGDTLLFRRYGGIKRRQAEADAKDAWREVMDAALARTMRDVATDPDLVAALTPASGGRSISRNNAPADEPGSASAPVRTP